MIGRLSGTLLEKHPPQILVDAGGVGYEVDVPMSTFCRLPGLNEPVVLWTHMAVREDAHLLFGFAGRAERELFRQLIRISGVGGKLALALLSSLEPDELARAVAQEDIKTLSRVPGIGKKTAERLILELRGKLGSLPSADLLSPAPAAGAALLVENDERADISQALQALGYSAREAEAALKSVPDGTDVATGIRLALKALARP
ncbi:Holliday junction branch migration protein RuvA [Laribacter hongkongensis]|uniref:Holliday junction branch migration complex subunit RuvA n=4 Tax=Laribacter hongkongensis TaxID=168471 RepID=RUVA_LARHH|nr:Holliday junction branch migration protein RuvA [Laribacter hongkongensis]C1D5S2.1 RecName: Full=Holliday junction branch migration complex subunit RuvA [Laribacter hongkongensis HLHK9]ACO76089.1 RuvA [Laribacter hongkongensis HLHK9]ASJ26130.1 holliday junction ATP-dependent DNA helicase RuvA [Laribacter hongkongensis]MBE5529587.1 Holliday junction DNA helicase RuvA [Laribacter hongkongensis]MCG8995200.1 Holliday junction branch migration protein RuvA [Laribacter hongkongensis]MCG9011467.1